MMNRGEIESIERMYKRGMLTDDVYFEINQTKQYLEQEMKDVVMAANELTPGKERIVVDEEDKDEKTTSLKLKAAQSSSSSVVCS